MDVHQLVGLLLLDGFRHHMDKQTKVLVMFSSIRWCVWSFRPTQPAQLPHLLSVCLCLVVSTLLPWRSHTFNFLFVCLFVCHQLMTSARM
jgi:hypothetical protein